MNARFTLDGSDALEKRLADICEQTRKRIEAAVPPGRCPGLSLGGGYGRGEGGVLKTAEGDQPYNDLEFYLFVRGNLLLAERQYGGALHEAAGKLSSEAGLEVEIKMLSSQKLRRSPVSMFYYDLLMGHRWLWGDDSLLAGCEHHRSGARIPLAEATRLLMNRCSGLLFAKERLEHERGDEPFTPADADFVGRNLAKAQLAFGDVVLAVQGQYHWSCRKRHQRLEKLVLDDDAPWLPDVQQEHMAGLEFKLHPYRSTASRATLLNEYARLNELGLKLWLWLEGQRLPRRFSSARDYALSSTNKCPETSAGRNRLVNIKAFGPGSLFRPRASRNPRERLLHALTVLLWEPKSCLEPVVLRKLEQELGASANSYADLVAAYRRLWKRFN
jgi:hypothetical protein